MPKPDAIRYTSSSEYSPRTRKCDTLEVHHATTPSLSGLESLMAPGGRTVSANEAMGSDGYRVGKVPPNMRAFTSASAFDNQAYTVEVCNTTLGPQWGISDAAHWALARLFVELYREGMVRGLFRGIGGIIGHKEVPGTYATACPGPSMDLDRVVRYAISINAGTAGNGYTPISKGFLMALDDDEQKLLFDRIAFLNDQANGVVAKDGRGVEFQLATAIHRVREILSAVDGNADPDENGQPVERLLARFLQNPAKVDNAALTKAVEAAVAKQVTAPVKLSDADRDDIATRVADKIAARLAN